MARTKLPWMFAVGACAVALASCGGGHRSASPTSTESATGSEPAISITPTAPCGIKLPGAEGPFQGGRSLVEARSRASTQPLLVNVTVEPHTDYDRITFEFQADGLPGCRVEYFPPLTQCASGEAVPIAGSAYLKVIFTASGHDERSTATVPETDLVPGLPTLAEAKQVCDEGGEVTWALGLNSVVDFRVVQLENPFRIAVDVGHP